MNATQSKPYHALDREGREQAVNDAESTLRAEYWSTVREYADDFIAECRDEGLDEEDARERLDETVDGCEHVIYTWKAQKVLLFSENQDAYAFEMGELPKLDGDGLNWSAMAYMAFMADIERQLDALDFCWSELPITAELTAE